MIKRLQESFSVSVLCQALGVHRSSFRKWLATDRNIDPDKALLRSEIMTAFKQSNGSAGARTLSTILTNKGIPLSRYRAGNLMKELQLVSSQPTAPKHKKANNEHHAVPNHLNRQFDVASPNTVWCGDVT